MAGQCAFHCIVTVLVSHLLLSSGISQLDFTTEPQDVVALPGEPLLVECEVTGKKPIDITWRQNSVNIVPNSRRNILGNGSLWFEEVVGTWNSSEDRGRYQCCAENSLGIICSRNVDISIARLTRPEVSLTNTAPVIVNGTARLVCHVESDPTPEVTWTKNDQPLQIDAERVTILQPGTLQITQVKISDAGSYSCSALNLVGKKTSPQFELDVTTLASLPQPLPHVPAIVAGPQNATLTSGSAYLLECMISSMSLQVEWSRKDGNTIPQDRSEIVGYSNLMLTRLRVSDSGIYICTAKEADGSTVQQSESFLNVTDPPVFTTSPEDLVVRDGAKARFHCTAEGAPTPQLIWVHNGKVLNDMTGRNSLQENNDLIIWNVREEDSGIYQCMASNEEGEIQASALLTVKLPVVRPGFPYNLTAIPLTSQSILIAWTPPNQTVMAYTLHFYKSAGGQEEFYPTSGTLSSFIVTNLQPYTNYTFYMRSYDSAPSLLSQSVSAMTFEGVPSCGPHMWLISNTPHSIEIHWQAVEPKCRNGIIVKYRYCYRQMGHKDYVCSEVPDTERKMTMIRLLEPSTTYSVAMSAATMMGFGTDTAWVMIRTPDVRDCRVPPAFPLEWSIVNSSFVQLTWQDPDPLMEQPSNFTINGFYLTLTSEMDGLAEKIYLAQSIRAYAFADLDAGTTYDVVLYAVNDCGSGQEWVEEITTPSETGTGSAADPEDPHGWPPPTNLQTISLSSSSIELVWNQPEGDIQPDYYLITYKPPISRNSKEQQPMSAYSSTCQVTIPDLKPYTMYEFTVQAILRIKDKEFKGQPSIIMYLPKVDEPSAPTNVDANTVDEHAVAVQWGPPVYANGIIATYIILYNKDYTQPESVWNKTERSGDTHNDIVGDLDSKTRYYFRVQARNQFGPGPSSLAVAATTLGMNPPILPPTGKPSGLDTSTERGILASIVLVTFLILMCTVAVVCRERVMKRNQRQAVIAARRNSSRHGYPYSNGNQASIGPPNGDMDMEMSPMLRSNGNHVSLQGNGTPGRRLCNSNSNHSPYFVRGNTQQGSHNRTNYHHHHHHHHLTDLGDSQTVDPECQVVVHQQQNPSNIHQHSSNQDGPLAESGPNNSSYNETQYLPEHHFNSGQCSPQVSGQSSPQIHTDQEEKSVLSEQEVRQQEQEQEQRDELGLHLPYTLPSLATTSGTGAPSGSHDSHLPPETNHREVGGDGGLDIWGVDDPHRPQSCGSTGGDSGMIDDMEWDAHDTSPDFVQKALLQVSGDASLYTV